MAIDTLVTIEQVKSSPPSGPGMAFRGFWKGVKGLAELIFSSPTAMIGLVIVIVWVLIAALAPIITTHDPLSQDYMQVDKGPPQRIHWGPMTWGGMSGRVWHLEHAPS